ncbi:hypothetical protein [Bradymonas sediminis]|uniref:Uncharacterized protein n=1 Tax=Bradymonas sediminis TaxID=1548548 RepID=A0A2Z4FMI1_9DELT|nr:hypothetical protein [Bradymonas sediminis]AWV90179.1 hypothetical protein DN745_12885 [Bradymonas sediminis]TDP75853.1 hypothetical protein DFR33_103200 [Bradymonas sediminis]
MGHFNTREMWWFLGFLGVALLAGFFLGGEVALGAQIALFDNMLKVSAIVLGVAGVWIGVLHGQELRALGSSGAIAANTAVEAPGDTIFERLIRLVLWSTFVVCLSLAVLIWGEAIVGATAIDEYKSARVIFFSLLSWVALFEIYLLLMSLIPLSDLDDKTRLNMKQKERRKRDQSRRE